MMEIKEIRDKVLEIGNVTSCAVMIVKKDGDITEYVVTDPDKTLVSLADLVEIASLISLRYDIVGYNKMLGGLKMTTDEFRDHLTISAMIEENLLVLVVPITVDLNKITQELKTILSMKVKNIGSTK